MRWKSKRALGGNTACWAMDTCISAYQMPKNRLVWLPGFPAKWCSVDPGKVAGSDMVIRSLQVNLLYS